MSFSLPFSHTLGNQNPNLTLLRSNPPIMISDIIYPELKTTEKLKFAGENFIIWKLKIDFVLADNKVDYVLTDPIPAGDQNQWLSDDSTCCQLILDTVEDRLHTLILPTYKHPTAKSIMDTIDNFCNFCSMNKRRALFVNYRNRRMSEGDNISRHIFEMRALARKLEMGGVGVSDEIQAVVLVSSLPDSWADVVEGLIVNGDKEGDSSLDRVCRKLMVTGEVRRWREGDDDRDPNKGLKKICYYCGRVGHFHSHCPDQVEMLSLSEMLYPDLKTTLRLNHMGTRFTIWKRNLSTVLRVNNVNYVLTDPKPPEEDTDSHKKWLTDDFTCRHIILGTMEDNLFLSFHNHPTAKSLLNTLDYFFNSPSLAHQTVMFEKYVGYRMSDDTNVRHHIAKLGGMAMELDKAGIGIPDEMQAVVLMESLPDSWENDVRLVTVNLDTDKEDGLKLDKVSERLRVAGDIRALFRAKDDQGQTSTNYNSNRKPKRAFRGNCYSCGRPGHCKSDCPYII